MPEAFAKLSQYLQQTGQSLAHPAPMVDPGGMAIAHHPSPGLQLLAGQNVPGYNARQLEDVAWVTNFAGGTSGPPKPPGSELIREITKRLLSPDEHKLRMTALRELMNRDMPKATRELLNREWWRSFMALETHAKTGQAVAPAYEHLAGAAKPDPSVVGTAAGAAADTAHFQRARELLGPNASLSQVLQQAQQLKQEAEAALPPKKPAARAVDPEPVGPLPPKKPPTGAH